VVWKLDTRAYQLQKGREVAWALLTCCSPRWRGGDTSGCSAACRRRGPVEAGGEGRGQLDLLASTNMAHTKTKAASNAESSLCPVWLPFVDAFRNELAVPSGDILGTFAALQDVVYTS
jgi:hypothetical protein